MYSQRTLQTPGSSIFLEESIQCEKIVGACHNVFRSWYLLDLLFYGPVKEIVLPWNFELLMDIVNKLLRLFQELVVDCDSC
ncbi:MAG TPA: hypothetical protein O0W91_02660 [Methanocorpusculum sp.]|nr:hypothetical protein [Methanocorpusculum sp.]